MPTHTSDSEDDRITANLQWICQSVLKDVFHESRELSIKAAFYPYIGLTHTMRRKGSTWMVRISDHCRRAPSPVLEAIVRILACKVMRRRPPLKAAQIYEHFRNEPLIADIVNARRLQKGKKHIAAHAGKFYSLHEIYLEVNRSYFNSQIEIRKIGWGLRKSRARLGHYDPVHHTVTLSPVLDSPGVPRFVISFIVYHEMLHAVFEGTITHAAHKHHPPEFRRAEKSHPDYLKTKKFLREFCRKQP